MQHYRLSHYVSLLPLVFLPALSQAGTVVFDFTDSGSGFTITGTLTATDNGDGSFTAVSGTGVWNSLSPFPNEIVTLSPNPNGTATYSTPDGAMVIDNQLFPGQTTLLDFYGLWFTFPGHGLNIFSSPGVPCHTWTYNGSTYDFGNDSSTFSLSASPEPSTVVLLVTGGLLLAVGKGWRRTR